MDQRRHPTGPTTAVYGTDLLAPVSPSRLKKWIGHAYTHRSDGTQVPQCRDHYLRCTAITEPGRPTQARLTVDAGTHAVGWWANSEMDRCLHLSLSHPRPDLPPVWRAPRPEMGFPGGFGPVIEEVSDAEARAWTRLVFAEHHTKTWFEPAASTMDPHRLPDVVHIRLFLDQSDRPIQPTGEVYTLRPWADGTSPAKITEGRAGADVR